MVLCFQRRCRNGFASQHPSRPQSSFSRTKDTRVLVRLNRVSAPSLPPSDELRFLSPKLAWAWEPFLGVLISWSWSRGHQSGVTLQLRWSVGAAWSGKPVFSGWGRAGLEGRLCSAPVPSEKPLFAWVGHDCQKEHGRQHSCESLLARASFTRVTRGRVFGCCTETFTSKAMQNLKN